MDIEWIFTENVEAVCGHRYWINKKKKETGNHHRAVVVELGALDGKRRRLHRRKAGLDVARQRKRLPSAAFQQVSRHTTPDHLCADTWFSRSPPGVRDIKWGVVTTRHGLSFLFWPSPIQGVSVRLLCLLFLSFDELDLFAGVTLWRAVLKGNTLTPSSELYRLHSENTARFLALEFHSHLYGSLSMGKMRVVFLLVSSQSKSFHWGIR